MTKQHKAAGFKGRSPVGEALSAEASFAAKKAKKEAKKDESMNVDEVGVESDDVDEEEKSSSSGSDTASADVSGKGAKPSSNKRSRRENDDRSGKAVVPSVMTEPALLSLLSHSSNAVRQGALKGHIIELTKTTKLTMGDVKKTVKSFLPVPTKIVERQRPEKGPKGKRGKGVSQTPNPKKDAIEAIRKDVVTYPAGDRQQGSAYALAIKAVRDSFKDK